MRCRTIAAAKFDEIRMAHEFGDYEAMQEEATPEFYYYAYGIRTVGLVLLFAIAAVVVAVVLWRRRRR